jgi:hypothetical protein
MITDNLKLMTSTHWAKVMLPVILLCAVLFLRSFILERVDGYLQSMIRKNTEIFQKVQSGQMSFAKAIAKEKKIALPAWEDFDRFKQSAFISRQENLVKVAPDMVQMLDQEFEEAPEIEVVLPPMPIHKVTGIFLGEHRKYSIINDKVISLGGRLDSGEVLARIENGKVLLKGKWGERWVYLGY